MRQGKWCFLFVVALAVPLKSWSAMVVVTSCYQSLCDKSIRRTMRCIAQNGPSSNCVNSLMARFSSKDLLKKNAKKYWQNGKIRNAVLKFIKKYNRLQADLIDLGETTRFKLFNKEYRAAKKDLKDYTLATAATIYALLIRKNNQLKKAKREGYAD